MGKTNLQHQDAEKILDELCVLKELRKKQEQDAQEKLEKGINCAEQAINSPVLKYFRKKKSNSSNS